MPIASVLLSTGARGVPLGTRRKASREFVLASEARAETVGGAECFAGAVVRSVSPGDLVVLQLKVDVNAEMLQPGASLVGAHRDGGAHVLARADLVHHLGVAEATGGEAV